MSALQIAKCSPAFGEEVALLLANGSLLLVQQNKTMLAKNGSWASPSSLAWSLRPCLAQYYLGCYTSFYMRPPPSCSQFCCRTMLITCSTYSPNFLLQRNAYIRHTHTDLICMAAPLGLYQIVCWVVSFVVLVFKSIPTVTFGLLGMKPKG